MQQRPLGRTGRDVSAIGLGTWQLGADWGDVSQDDRARGAEGIRRSRCDALRHRRRLRRRAQRVADRAIPRAPPGAWHHGRHQDGSPDAAGAVELCARELPGVDRALAPQPRCRHARSRAAALPADGSDRGCRHLRRARCSRRRRCDRRLWRLGRDVCAGARRDRAAERDEHPDHLQSVPAEAARRGASGGPGRGSLDLRARPARVGSAVGEVHLSRRRSRPTITVHTTVTARRSIAARRSRASTTRSGWRLRPSCRRRFPRACRCRRRRSRGSRRRPA